MPSLRRPRAYPLRDTLRETLRETDGTPDRLSSEARRETLLDIAVELLRSGGPEKVTMGTVAERAGVTRALVYKHFANRDELLSAVFRREAAKLDSAMVARVAAAQGLEDKLRTFVRAVLQAVDTHGPIFTPLQAQSSHPGFLDEQRKRDRRTVRFFAELASTEYDLSARDATAAMSVLLSGIASLRSLARAKTSAAQRESLENLFVDLVIGGLTRLRSRTKGVRR